MIPESGGKDAATLPPDVAIHLPNSDEMVTLNGSALQRTRLLTGFSSLTTGDIPAPANDPFNDRTIRESRCILSACRTK